VFFVDWPLGLRLTILFVMGAASGSFINLVILRARVQPRYYSPWNDALDWLLGWLPWNRSRGDTNRSGKSAARGAPRLRRQGRRLGGKDPIAPRAWPDKIPIFGWYFLRREESLQGEAFWVRPLAIELGCGLGCAWLYWWEVVTSHLVPPVADPPAMPLLHAAFVSHWLLFCLMLAASWIDFDEQVIPDLITVPGTLLALLLAAALPDSVLAARTAPPGMPQFQPLHIAAPLPWPGVLAGGTRESLAIALVAIWGWSLALLPRTWRGRRGWRFALQLIFARIVRDFWTYLVLAMGLLLTIAVGLIWHVGGPSWQALLSSLVGLAVGGGMIWIVRCIGFLILRREAMGFGDVTLMAMIGAFLGWQPCLFVFFIGPFFGLVPGIVQLVTRREGGIPIPYGPFLCLGAATTVIFWRPLWVWAEPMFQVGWLIPLMMFVCGPVMALLLALIQVLKYLWWRIRLGGT
jgi:prepilin signal peptidase PulO-like enzyme (type II secretory pathway)